MSNKMRPYIVHQGDYLNKIAFKHGFIPDEVWNDEANSDLNSLRKSPDQLYPGDVLYIPTTAPEGLPLAAARQNGFHAKIPTIPVTLAFEEAGKPLRGHPCEVRGLPGTTADAPMQQTTSPLGALELTVPVTVRELEIFFPKLNIIYHVDVGSMDPEDEHTGVKKRLRNLGYLSLDPQLHDDDTFVPGALRTFQLKEGLEPTGELDEPTRAALVARHGG